MIIEILVPADGARRWHLLLRDRLQKRLPGSSVVFARGARMSGPPGPVRALLMLERMVVKTGPARLIEQAPPSKVEYRADSLRDFVIDCTDAPVADARDGRGPRVLFAGVPGELGMLDAILSGKMPWIEIVDRTNGRVLMQGRTSPEATRTFSDSLDAVLSRAVEMLTEVVANWETRSTGDSEARGANQHGSPSVASYLMKRIAVSAARLLYHLCFNAPHWKVGWRVNPGPSAFETGDLEGEPWNVLPDDGSFFCADPFPVTWRGQTAIFFELLHHERGGKGVIAGVNLEQGRLSSAYFSVIEGPHHLSYPFVFEHADDLWMIPECSTSKEVVLYRCVDFPRRWEPTAVLLRGFEAADSTLLQHEGRFWLMSSIRDGVGAYSDMLAIHHATRLEGPWIPHENRPVLVDAAAARPAGRMFWHEGCLIRPVQDCSIKYGTSINFARVDALAPDRFHQTIVSSLNAGGSWSGGRVHTWNRVGQLECIDGIRRNPKRPTFLRTPVPVEPAVPTSPLLAAAVPIPS